MKTLMVFCNKGFENYLGQWRWELYKELLKQTGVKAIVQDEHVPFSENEIVIVNVGSDIHLGGFHHSVDGECEECNPATHVCVIDDVHLWGSNEEVFTAKYNIFFSKIISCFAMYSTSFLNILDAAGAEENAKAKILKFSHFASSFLLQNTWIKPFQEREAKIALIGKIDCNYDARVQVLSNSFSFFDIHDHPGYRSPSKLFRDQYAEALSSYRFAFADGVMHTEENCSDPKRHNNVTIVNRKYLVAKFFEIPAVGTVLLADSRMRDELSVEGFLDGIHYLSIDKENMKNDFQKALQLPQQEWEKLSNAGRELVLSSCTAQHRAQKILELASV